MARLLADLPAVLAHAIYDRLSQMAEAEHAAARDAARAGADPDAVAGRTGSDSDIAYTGARAGNGTHDADLAAGSDPADTDDCGELRLSTGPDKDERSLDELRADIFADLVLTGAPTAHGEGDALASIRAHVQITVPVLTAAGESNEPALLAGYGPIDRETARVLAAGAPGWDRVMYHPHTGLPLAVDRYRPSAELKRFLFARDERCRFPGCRRRPWRCDIDHTVDRARGGPTSECNLAHFCRRHHTVKHATAWRVQQIGGGVLEWISLTGRRYLDKPPAVVQFVPSGISAKYLACHDASDAPF